MHPLSFTLRRRRSGIQAEAAGRALASNIQHLHANGYQQPGQQVQSRWLMPPPQVPLRRLENIQAKSPLPPWRPGPSVVPVTASPPIQQHGDVPATQAYPATVVPRHGLEVSLSEVEDLPCSQESFAQYSQLEDVRPSDGGAWSQRGGVNAIASHGCHVPQLTPLVTSPQGAAAVRSSNGLQDAPTAVQLSTLPAAPSGAWTIPADIHTALQLPFG